MKYRVMVKPCFRKILQNLFLLVVLTLSIIIFIPPAP